MTRLSTFLLTTTLLSAGLVLPSLAQQSAPASPPAASPAPMPTTTVPAPEMNKPDPGNDEAKAHEARAMSEAADRSAMFEAHVAALHAGLTLTADQDKLWAPVEAAIRGFATMRSSVQDRRSDLRQDMDEPIAALKVAAQDQLDYAQALKALADAAGPLYAALDADQKHRLPMLLGGLVPPRGPLARMVARLHQDQHEGDSGQDQGPMRPRWGNEQGGPGWGWREGMRRGQDGFGQDEDRRDDRHAERGGWRHGREPGYRDPWQGGDEGEMD